MERQQLDKNRMSVGQNPRRPTSQDNFQGHPQPSPSQKLQRALGNQAFGQLLQAKLEINQAGDIYEQEADRMAEQVMCMPAPQMTSLSKTRHGVQRKCAACASGAAVCPTCAEEEKHVQRKALTSTVASLVRHQDETPKMRETVLLQNKEALKVAPKITPEVSSDLVELKGGGQPLSPSVRPFFESRFGMDFAQVRVHTDRKSADTATNIGAQAFTFGNDIAFGAGHYSPHSSRGKKLLAHELTHVVQQAGVKSAPVFVQRQEAEEAEEPGVFERIGDSISGAGRSIRETSGRAISEAGHFLRCLLPATVNPWFNPLRDISTFQSPGASGWWGAKFGCYRNNCNRRHRGWDIHAPVGTEVRAVVEGRVRHRQNPGGYGDYIVLTSQNDPDRSYRYAHLAQREPQGTYCVGDKIGETGVTGNASANRPHLHFEVRTNNVAEDPDNYLSEPTMVVERLGSAITIINKADPEPCAPC